MKFDSCKESNLYGLRRIHSRDFFFNELNPLDRIQKCETLREIKIQITATVHSACEYVEKKKRTHNFLLKDNIIRFIQENYADINLNVQMIAYKFEMIPSIFPDSPRSSWGTACLTSSTKSGWERSKS